MKKRTVRTWILRRSSNHPEPPYPGYQEHRKRRYWFGAYHYGEKGFSAGLFSIIFGFLLPIVGFILGAIGIIYGTKALVRDQDFALSSIAAGAIGFILATLWTILTFLY
jgi:hypothetical protein